MSQIKRIAILGSTGSIGTQALEVIAANPDKFKAEVLTAGNNADLLIEQARSFNPSCVVIANEELFPKVKQALSPLSIKVLTGEQALEEVVQYDQVGMVLTALVGFAGLKPTIAAIKASKDIALSNKETLVVAGSLISSLSKAHKVSIIPVDSEHSALFQCLIGEDADSIEKLILTASGGPFRAYSEEQLANVTKEQALKHPNWEMGAKITIDSASMMNKGLEVIEAYWLFDIPIEQIEVVVHPQSIIHSMVQFRDGSIKAQMGLPDMRLPIQYALSFPKRIVNTFPRYNFLDYPSLTFESVDQKVFRNLGLAFEAILRGGNLPCSLNAANEETNRLFREGHIGFLDIGKINEKVIAKIDWMDEPTLEELIETDKQSRILANKLANSRF